jgi:hypothetical protein
LCLLDTKPTNPVEESSEEHGEGKESDSYNNWYGGRELANKPSFELPREHPKQILLRSPDNGTLVPTTERNSYLESGRKP